MSTELDEVEVKEMVAQQRRNDTRLKKGEVRITPFAVRCLRHGRCVLSKTDMGLDADAGYLYYGIVDLESLRPCPHCGSMCKLDMFWYEHTKNRFNEDPF